MPDASEPQDDNPTERHLEAGRLLFAANWEFERGVVRISDLPAQEQPEIAFAGRSNVGKSSLINALLGRKSIARTSNTPGRTQELNFFRDDGRLRVVDMPGYGYAAAPKKKVDLWTRLVKDYLRGRAVLTRVFLLIDARHGVKPVDREIMKLLDESAVSYQCVLTKTDKLTPAQRPLMLETTQKAIAKNPAAHPIVLPTSAQTGDGIAELRGAVAALLEAYT